MKNFIPTLCFENTDKDFSLIKYWFVLLIILTCTAAHAQKTWDGSHSDNWFHVHNWSPTGVPDSDDDVTIPAGTPNDPVIDDGYAYARSVTVQSGASLTLDYTVGDPGILTIAPIGTNGLTNSGTITNHGKIDISRNGINANSHGIDNDGGTIINDPYGNLPNTGIINIDDMDDNGILNRAGTSFTNSGTINIGQGSGDIGLYGIRVGGSGAQFVNDNGIIKIDNTVDRGFLVAFNGVMTNQNNGELRIGQGDGNIGDVGLQVQDSGTQFVNNNGIVKIDNTTNVALAVLSDSKITNINGGQIQIGQGDGNIGDVGLQVQNSGAQFVNNNGIIKIDNTASDGLTLVSNGAVTNQNNGQIRIGQAGGSIGLHGIFTCSACTLTNDTGAEIHIGEQGTISWSAIRNNGTFNNLGCDNVIRVYSDNRIVNTGTFDNSGLIMDHSSGSSNISTNTGAVINGNGGTFTCGGNTPLEVEIGVADKLWTGCDGLNWATTDNWYPAGVPAATESVNISDTDKQPNVPVGTAATAQSVTIGDGALLVINGSLAISNSTDAGLTNAGTVNNNAIIQIDNTAGDAVLNETTGVFNNNSGGELEIGRNGGNIVGKGINNEGGIFNNNDALILIDNVHHGIQYSDGGVFENKAGGEIVIGEVGALTSASIYDPNTADFYNRACAHIEIHDGFINSGDLVNEGVLIQHANTSNVIGSNTGIVHFTGTGSFDTGTGNAAYTNPNAKIWTGCTDNDFDTDNNWHDRAPIGATDDIVIPDMGNDPVISSSLLYIINSIHIESGGSLTCNNDPSLLIKENWTNDGSFTAGTSKVVMFELLAEGRIKGTSTTLFYDLLIQKFGETVIAEQDFTVENELEVITGTIEIPVGATATSELLTISGGTLDNEGTVWANVDLEIETGGTAQGNGHYNIKGNWHNSGTFNAGTSTVVFRGTTPSVIEGSSPTPFYLLRVNKQPGGGVSLLTGATVDYRLVMANEHLDLNGQTIELLGNGIIFDEDEGSYVYDSQGTGSIFTTKDMNQPSGENLGNLGVEVTSSANLGSVTISRGHDVQDVNGESGIVRYYDISPANNSGLDATVRFHYLDAELNGIAESDLTPFRFNGTDWDDYPVNANDPTANWVETTNVDAFSIWTLASSAAVLPVELVRFSATQKNEDVLLDWETASETNNEGFEIEHSSNGRDWNYLGFVAGAGSTVALQHYDYVHESPSAGMNYYRLKQLDFDGKFEYSNIVSVNFESANEQILQVYPNPFQGELNIVNGEGQVTIFNVAGQFVGQFRISEKATNLQTVDMPDGVYTLLIQKENRQIETVQVVKQSPF